MVGPEGVAQVAGFGRHGPIQLRGIPDSFPAKSSVRGAVLRRMGVIIEPF